MTHSDDFLGAAGFAFEKQRGVRLSSYEVNEIEAAGLVDADCEHLADIIWASLEEPQIEDYRISAYWALGKRWRETDVPKFIETRGVSCQEAVTPFSRFWSHWKTAVKSRSTRGGQAAALARSS